MSKGVEIIKADASINVIELNTKMILGILFDLAISKFNFPILDVFNSSRPLTSDV